MQYVDSFKSYIPITNNALFISHHDFYALHDTQMSSSNSTPLPPTSITMNYTIKNNINTPGTSGISGNAFGRYKLVATGTSE